MSRSSNSKFYEWLSDELGKRDGKKKGWGRLSWFYEVDSSGNHIKHPEYHPSIADHYFEVINDKTLLIDGKDFIHLEERIVRVEINPFSSGKNAAMDIFFISDFEEKLSRWFRSLTKSGVDSDHLSYLGQES